MWTGIATGADEMKCRQLFLFAATLERREEYRIVITEQPDKQGNRWRAALDFLVAAGLEEA